LGGISILNRARMILLVLALCACAASQSKADEVFVLQNMRPVAPYAQQYGEHLYMNCDDTYVSSAAPDANFGGSQQIVLEPGRTKALIRFTQLNRAIGVNRQITKATLVLFPVRGRYQSADNQIRLSKALVNWGEGSADGQPNYWGASWKERLSSAKEKGHAWGSAGIQAGTDCAPNPTVSVDPMDALGLVTDVASKEILKLKEGQDIPKAIVIEGLKDDVQSFYNRHYTNFGWVIDVAAGPDAKDTVAFHSSQSKQLALRPMLIVETKTTAPPVQSMDLSVIYIERTPEYLRYAPADPKTGKEYYEYKPYHGKDDVAGILKKPGFMNEKKWPAEGEEVTFTAHVKNVGKDTPSGPFNYTIYINEEKASSGVYEGKDKKGLPPGEETTFSTKWKWHADHARHDDQTVTVNVEPVDTNAREVTKNNNQFTDYIEALNLGYYFDEKSFASFSRYQNGLGSYAPEDWAQWEWNIWNETVMAKSRYAGLAPDGCLERVRIQRISVHPNGKLQGGNHIPDGKSDFRYDGEWGTDNAPEGYSAGSTKVMEHGLIHECTHQICAIDNYWSNMDGSNEKGEGGKVHFKLDNGLYLTRSYWDWDGGMMGGGHTRPSPDEPPYGGDFLSSITCGGLNSDLGYRRGFFGDYTYDLPEKLTIVAQDWAGKPIPNAEVTVFQSAAGSLTEQYPVVSGKTNEKGEIVVPPQPIMEDAPVTIATGHTIRPNPWGRVNVVGGNMVFLIRVKADGQTSYRFLKSLEANVAYWSGAKDNWVCPLGFVISQGGVKSENAARGASIVTSKISRNTAPLATDGDLKTVWDTGCGEGSYFEVDLAANHNIGRIEWVGATNAGFDIWVSETGNFSGEQRRFYANDPCISYWSEHNDPVPADPKLRTVSFANEPIKGRYVRFVCTTPGWFRVNELNVFENAK
jgi:cytochrome b involved in lipid metabolism